MTNMPASVRGDLPSQLPRRAGGHSELGSTHSRPCTVGWETSPGRPRPVDSLHYAPHCVPARSSWVRPPVGSLPGFGVMGTQEPPRPRPRSAEERGAQWSPYLVRLSRASNVFGLWRYVSESSAGFSCGGVAPVGCVASYFSARCMCDGSGSREGPPRWSPLWRPGFVASA